MLDFNSTYDLLSQLPTEQDCINYLVNMRWKNGEYCPYCQHEHIYHFADNKTYKCQLCKQKFSIKVGTIFENTKVPLRKWFLAIFIMTTHKKGASSLQLARDIKVTQKTAWFMLHRIRKATQLGDFNDKLDGTVEMDETYIGGLEKNKHFCKKTKGTQGRSHKKKSIVLGMLQRDGDLKATVVDNVTAKTIENEANKNIVLGSVIMSDEWKSYRILRKSYQHKNVNHSRHKYVIDDISTNSIESFWATFKRGLKGVYHIMSKKHLHRYVNEFVFRYNLRKESRSILFHDILSNVDGRLTYKRLVGAY
jgi:transposase-like protein